MTHPGIYVWLRIFAFSLLWQLFAPVRPIYIDVPLIMAASVMCEYWYLFLTRRN